MRRREFVAGAAFLAAISRAAAEQDSKLRRLAIFSPSLSAADMQENSGNRYWRATYSELRRLGHVEGENLTVERYGKEQNTAGLDAMLGRGGAQQARRRAVPRRRICSVESRDDNDSDRGMDK